jgi:hypothetical protein
MLKMQRLRRTGKAVIIVLGVTWSLLGVLPHQAGALSPALTNSLDVRLVAQNFNVLAGTQFRFTVGVPDEAIRNQLDQDPTTTLRITAFAPVTTREQVRSIVGGAEPVGQLAVADLRLIQLARTDVNTYTAFLSTTARTNSLRLTKDGVYPIQISFVREGQPISKLNTFVNFFNSPTETSRLPVSIASTVTTSLALAPNGTIVISDATRKQLTDLALSLEGGAAPLSVQVSPEILDGLARSTQPVDVVLLTRLQSAFANHDLLRAPFVPFDPSSAMRTERTNDFSQLSGLGDGIIELRNGEKNLSPNIWFSNVLIDEDGAKLLHDFNVHTVVLTPQAAAKIGTLDNYAKPYRISSDVALRTTDPLYATALTGKPNSPVITAYSLAAELLTQRQEVVDGGGVVSSNFVVLTNTNGTPIDTALLAPLAVAIDRAPQLRLRALSSLPRANSEATLVKVPRSNGIDVSIAGKATDTLADELASTSLMLPTDAPQRLAWSTSKLVMLDDRLSSDDFAMYFKGFRNQLRLLRASVKVPQSLSFTLGGRESDLRLQLRNDAAVDLTVSVEISSAKLQFPDEDRIVTVPANGAIDLVIPVVARASGRFPIEVVLYTPDGLVQAGQRVQLTARVAAIAGLGLVVSGAAALVLLAWWLSHWRAKRRKSASKQHPAIG